VIAGAVGTVGFAQSPPIKPVAANDPERPVKYISLHEALERAVKNETVNQAYPMTAEQLRIFKPLPTGFVTGGVCIFPEDQPEARIKSLFEKAAAARIAGRNEVAQAYYESISYLSPLSKYAKEATRLLEEMKEPVSEERTEDLRHFTEFPDPNRAVPYQHFWFLTIPASNLRYEHISGSTGP
jgi:hypothetical protein